MDSIKTDIEPEIQAMAKAYEAVKNLDCESQSRVMSWLKGKLALKVVLTEAPADSLKPMKPLNNLLSDIANFDSLGELFSASQPKTDVEKALVASAYLQIKNKLPDLGGREVNSELNHLGHRAGNITVAIGNLVNRKPSLMVQLRKEGKSKQAIKKYKVTGEGISHVKEMIKSIRESNLT